MRPIKVIDAYRRFYQLALLASAGVAIDGIGAAAPAVDARAAERRPRAPSSTTSIQAASTSSSAASARTRSRSAARARGKRTGMLLGNPHFPWDGSERFYQAHLTIPGKVNVQGGSLFGVPIILIGNTTRDGVEPHRLHGAALHALPVDDRAGRPARLPRRRPGRSR